MNKYQTRADRIKNIVNFRNGMHHNARQSVAVNDMGPLATAIDLEEKCIQNEYFRRVLWTGVYLQLTVMSIPVGGQIPPETHEDNDQMIYIERGTARVIVANEYQAQVGEGYGIFIPAGKEHTVKNVSTVPLKLFSVYAPPEHSRGTYQK